MKHTFDNLIDSKTGEKLEIELDESQTEDFYKAREAGGKAGQHLKDLMAMEPLEERLTKEQTIDCLDFLILKFEDIGDILDDLFEKHSNEQNFRNGEKSFKFNDSQKFDKE